MKLQQAEISLMKCNQIKSASNYLINSNLEGRNQILYHIKDRYIDNIKSFINKLYHIQSPYVALILPFHTLRKINNNNAVDFMLGILLFTTGSVWEKA